MKCWMESASSWVLISHYIFGHLHSLTSLLGWGLCSVLKVQSWGTQTLKSQNRHIILIYIFFQALNVWLPTLPWICLMQLLCLCHPLPSALNVFCLQCILPTSPLGECLLLRWGLAHITFSLKPSLSFPRQSFSVLYDAPIPDFALFKVVAFISLYTAHPRNTSLSLSITFQ